MELHASPWAKIASATVRSRFPRLYAAVVYLKGEVAGCEFRLTKLKRAAMTRITGAATAILCTSASVGPALRDERIQSVVKRATTVVVDEAGSVGDRHVLPIIANCVKLQRMVLVGDTKQLGVFTYIREDGVTVDVSSLMLRLEQQGIGHHFLTLQYRMPPELAFVISTSIYGGLVQSAIAPRLDASDPMVYIDVMGEVRPERPGSTSMVNEEEAKEASTEATRLVQQMTNATVAILCLHAAQKRHIEKLLASEVLEQVDVLTVDASQGREWDHAIISLVSVEVQGSVRDPRKQCVMLSRAKCTVTLIAHPCVVATQPLLAAFREAGVQRPTLMLASQVTEVEAEGPSLQDTRGALPNLADEASASHTQTGSGTPRRPPSLSDSDSATSPYFASKMSWAEFTASLAPTKTTQRRYSACLKEIANTLRTAKDEQFTVIAVEAAGSHAKGTDTEFNKDLDVVVKYKDFEPARVSEYLTWAQKVLNEAGLLSNPTKQMKNGFKFEVEGMKVDLLATGDLAELQSPWPRCFDDMAPRDRECWRIACTQQSVDFMRDIAREQPLCTDIVRVAKYWRDKVIVTWPAESYPFSFLLELLVCASLSDGLGGPIECTSVELGFTNFLQRVVNFKKLYVTWNFAEADVPRRMLMCEPPLVLDPIDHHNNVAKEVKWDDLAHLARMSLERLTQADPAD